MSAELSWEKGKCEWLHQGRFLATRGDFVAAQKKGSMADPLDEKGTEKGRREVAFLRRRLYSDTPWGRGKVAAWLGESQRSRSKYEGGEEGMTGGLFT